jgi:phage terminase large subunit-like protein
MPPDVAADYQHFFLNPFDNAQNLAAGYLTQLDRLPERARRRFRDGVYQDEIDGALWSLESLDACRVDEDEVPDLQRIVVAIDPSGHNGSAISKSDEIGINVSGRGVNGHGYVLEDLTCALSPEGWGRRAVEAYHRHRADCIVGEANFGGDMVRAIVHAVDPKVKFKLVTASRGKVVRAEPISAFYEERLRQVHHVGDPAKFRELEDELLLFSTTGYQGDKSPNRADAKIWALTELMLGATAPAIVAPVVSETANYWAGAN